MSRADELWNSHNDLVAGIDQADRIIRELEAEIAKLTVEVEALKAEIADMQKSWFRMRTAMDDEHYQVWEKRET